MINDGFFHCDYCQGRAGQFNTETGNHAACERIAVLEFNVCLMLDALTKIADLEEHTASSSVIDLAQETIKGMKKLQVKINNPVALPSVNRHYAFMECGNEQPGDRYTESDDPDYVTCPSCRALLLEMVKP